MNERSLTGPPPAGDQSLHTLPEIAAVTGIPLDDLRLYRREFALRIPIAGGDGPRRYPQAAVETFRSIHREQTGTDGGRSGGPLVQGRRLFSLAAQRQRDAAATVQSPAGNGHENGNGGKGAGDDNGHREGSKGHTASAADSAAAATPAAPAAPETSPPEEVHDPGPPSAFEELHTALALLAPTPDRAATQPAAPRPDRGEQRGSDATRSSRPGLEREAASEPPRSARAPGNDAAGKAASRRGGPQARTASGPDSAPKPNLPPRPPRRPTPPPQRPRGAATSSSTASDAFARFLGIGSGGDGEAASETASATLSESTPKTPPSGTESTPSESLESGTPRSQTGERGTTSNGTVVATEGTEPLPVRDPRPTRPIYTLQEIHELTSIPYAKLSLFAAQHFDEIPWVGERYSPAYTRQGVEAFCRLYAAQNPGWQVPELGPERGWDDLGGLSARIHALASAQEQMADSLEEAVESFLRPWTGEAQWEI